MGRYTTVGCTPLKGNLDNTKSLSETQGILKDVLLSNTSLKSVSCTVSCTWVRLKIHQKIRTMRRKNIGTYQLCPTSSSRWDTVEGND
ncbi:unnamed protein product [Rhodiola kirilowii]